MPLTAYETSAMNAAFDGWCRNNEPDVWARQEQDPAAKSLYLRLRIAFRDGFLHAHGS